MNTKHVVFHFASGDAPLLVSMPHVGTELPAGFAERLSAPARALPDTDWHIDRLYDFVDGLGASILRAHYSRYVIDLNRPPDDVPLYPGSAGIGLIPTILFDGTPLYRGRITPDKNEIAERLRTYWRPYHDHLARELERIRAKFGFALLFDAHSIRSIVPRLFDGRLPDVNLGTGGGTSADETLARALVAECERQRTYDFVLNGRFKGGYITRHYGKPADHVHAVQLELSQRTYMDEDPPFAFEETLANAVRPLLRAVLVRMLDWAESRYRWRARA
ncbi:MAG TPA: N-formylglutamate deformylase [Burkholderiales bacterium]|nr:N-formylglutamate deformylase [Burkholderiales bacterium]